MSLVTDVQAILRDASSDDIRPHEASERLWRLDYPSLFSARKRDRSRRVDDVKRQLLLAVAQTGTATIYHSESPTEEGLPGRWQSVGQPSGWFLPSDLDLEDDAIAHWLFSLGNWTVCSHALAPEPMPDFFRAPVVDTLSWLDARKLDVVIDSFHDDTSWVIGLGDVHTASK